MRTHVMVGLIGLLSGIGAGAVIGLSIGEDRAERIVLLQVDPQTGCEYLVRRRSITPRLGPNGAPLCTRAVVPRT